MAEPAISQIEPERKRLPSRPRTGQHVPCDECGNLHYRKNHRLRRNINPKRRIPTAGLWLCSDVCVAAVEQRTHVIQPCLKCGAPVDRRRSQLKLRSFCSKQCLNEYGRQRVACSWPGCAQTLECRSAEAIGRDGRRFLEYKINLVKKGHYTKYVLCRQHRELAQRHLGRFSRLSGGRNKLLRDADAVFAMRAASGKFLRLVLFDRAGCKCQGCGDGLAFDAPPKTWQVDHATPVFRGGKTSLGNLQILCAACHDKKSAVEKSEVTRERHSLTKTDRWMTHHEKDLLIERLRSRLRDLGAPTD